MVTRSAAKIDYKKESRVSSVLISPQDKRGFLRELASRAGGLEVSAGV